MNAKHGARLQRPVAAIPALLLAIACGSEPEQSEIAPRWVQTLGGEGYQEPLAVATSTDGSIAVAGIFTRELSAAEALLSGDGSIDGFVVVLDADGKVRWARSLLGPGDDGLMGVSFVDGSVVVSGHAGREAALAGEPVTGTTESSALVARFTPDGELEWQRGFGGDGHQVAHTVSATRAGNLVVAGDFASTVAFETPFAVEGATDSFVVELDPAGEVVWARAIAGAGSELIDAISVGADGSVAISGTSQEPQAPDGSSEHERHVSAFVAAIAPDGTEAWSKPELLSAAHHHGGSGHMMIEQPRYLARNSRGQLVVGTTRGAMFGMHGEDFEAPRFDAAVVLGLDDTGGVRWHAELSGTAWVQLAGVAPESPFDRIVGSFSGELEVGSARLRSSVGRSLFTVGVLEDGLGSLRRIAVSVGDSPLSLTAIDAAVAANGGAVVAASAVHADGDRDLLLLELPAADVPR